MTIQGFDLLGGQVLKGTVIRCTDDDGRYILGCRMPEDNAVIEEYVKAGMSQ